MRRWFKDHALLNLLDCLIDHSNDQDTPIIHYPGDDLFTPLTRRCGLPIGNLTSQWLANLYLDGFDHQISSRWGFGSYIRYCDDFIVFGDCRDALRHLYHQIQTYCDGLRLTLHDERAHIRHSREGVTFLGYRIWHNRCNLTKEAIHRFRRRLMWMKKQFTLGKMSLSEVQARISSWWGHAGQADSIELLQRFLPDFRWFHDPTNHPDVQ